MPLDDTLARKPAPKPQRKPAAKPKPNAKAQAALEYHVAATLARDAAARKKAAHKAAVSAAVLPDHETNPREPGTSEVCYDDGKIRIVLTVAEPIEKLDTAPFVDALVRAGMKPAVLARLVKRHTRTTAAAHVFSSSVLA
jgi:hypothetical protein